MRKMKVLMVYPITLDIYLHNAAILQVLKHFSELDHQVTLFSLRSKGISKSENSSVTMSIVPIRFVPIISPIIFGIILSVYLPFTLLLSKPDFVIMIPEFSIIGCIPSLLIAKFRKTKFVLDIRSVPVETDGFRGSLQNFWYGVSLLIARKFFGGITIITQLMKKEVSNSFALNPERVGVWTSGVSETLFDPKKIITKKVELKEKLGLTGKFVVFYHGVFTPTRGLTETIEAVDMLRKKYPNIVFFLLGSGPTAETLKNLIRNKSLQNNVILHDPVNHSEVPSFIGMSDVCIVPLPNHPYWRHQSPLNLLEYLAMEKVVILTDLPAHKAIIEKTNASIYISSNKPKEIADAIEHAYSNKEFLQEWGKIGREVIKKEYTWEKISRDLENYLLSINNESLC